jgi:Tfp pilus assembly protein PilN
MAEPLGSARDRPIRLDLNFLPERYRGPRVRLSVLRPWLFLTGFALLLIPSIQLIVRHLGSLAAVQSAFETVSAELEAYQPLADERAALEGRISSAEGQASAIEAAYQIINIHRVTWSDLVPRILAAVPDGLALTLVNHSAEQVILEGLAAEYRLPSAFADNLQDLPDFSTVSIQSVQLLLPEEQPAVELEAEGETPAEPPLLYKFQIILQFPAVEGPEPQPGTQE